NNDNAVDSDLAVDDNITNEAAVLASQAEAVVPANDKKAKIAAAVAKAKARKLAQQQDKLAATPSEEKTNKHVKSEST
ncbi:hypothetical protein, partial [Colwellia hornerae]